MGNSGATFGSWLLIGLGAMVVSAACAGCGARARTDPSPRPVGGLMILSDPDGARLFVDDKYVGATSRDRFIHLPAGAHRIEVRADGHFAHYSEITVVEGVRQKLEVQLRKEPF